MDNKKKLSALLLSAVGVMGVAGISAYFTDADTATNTFTVGKVSMDLQEPNWEPPTDITPNEEFEKDPQIKNDGINDEYIFMEVIVPYAEVITADAEGNRNAKAWTELFSYEVNAGWVELEAQKVVDEDAGTVKHLYAYAPALDQGMTALAKDATSETLFDYIRFANVIEDEGLEGATKHVVVNAYGIQTNFLTDETLDGVDDGIDTPAEVWAVLSTQGPSTDKGAEAPNTDIIQ